MPNRRHERRCQQGSVDVAPLTPARLLDTRDGTGGTNGPVGKASTVELAVHGQAGVPTDAKAAIVNITALNASRQSFVTVWPGAASKPATSTLNPQPGRVISNEIVVPIGDNGRINLYNHNGQVDLLVDLVGVVPATSTHIAPTPARLLDTRDGTGGTTIALGHRRSCNLPVAGKAGVPNDARAVVVNVTALNSATETFVSVWPSGAPRPATSTLNPRSNEVVANEIVVSLGTDGAINLYNHNGQVDLVIDIVGVLR